MQCLALSELHNINRSTSSQMNLQTCHSCRVHCKPYQHAPIYNLPRDRRVGRPLSQIFKRPRITQTSTITKNMENQTKKT